MFKKTVIAAGLGLAISSAAQAEYQWELGANSGTGDIDLGQYSADQDFFGLTGAYYFDRVDTSKGPLAEAAFLDRASNIELDLRTGEVEGDNEDYDVDSYAAGSRLVLGEGGWIVDLGARRDEIENTEIDTFSFGGGKYVLENTAVVLSYSNIDEESTDDVDEYNLGVEHLWLFEQGALKLDGNIGRVDFEDRDDVDVWGLDTTYYVTDRLGFGVGYENRDSDDVDRDRWSLFGQWFATEQVALSLGYTNEEENDIDYEADAIMFTADVRF